MRRRQGLALVAVLWLVAALSIIVAGLLQSVRTEARLGAQLRGDAQAAAAAEAAMQLALQSLLAEARPLDRLIAGDFVWQDQPIAVQVMPLNGYIDLNAAPPELLAQMFQTAAGLPQDQANTLAQALLRERTQPGASGAPPGFEAVEDLLRVPGIDYPLYARVAPLLTADLMAGSGRVNPLAAPPAVLRVLTGGNDAAAAQYTAARAAGDAAASAPGMNTAWLDAAAARVLELQALVPLADGARIRVVRRYALAAQRLDGLPWRAFYARSFVDPAAAPAQ
ncbi:MAG: hypothetical protein BGO13_02760 [Burkholderiales bacterium 66-5]|uniref:hypothetical protein n=1 Tax=Comamonas badia TaxID=265291 RepID=UPI0004210AA8|nr:hypothetical protein [Comamonas badia]OJU92568.1 MAG: hypothetical protein BGO13_02760 [Burkholderiales bacterium 66-5]